MNEAAMHPLVRGATRFIAALAVVLISRGTAYADNPATCLAVKQATPGAADGEYTLFWQGDATKPWQAYCKGMAGATPTEYLTLPDSGSANPPNVNFSSNRKKWGPDWYPFSNVFTAYQKVRLDSVSLRVDVNDQSFVSAATNGPSNQPYAFAGACDQSPWGRANIDLRGTPFSVAANVFATTGWNPQGSWSYASHNQVVNLIGGGFCGGTTIPDSASGLQLVYTNPIAGIQIDAVGNVGVGAPVPAADLHVLGTARVDGNLVVSGTVQGQQPGYLKAAILEGTDTRNVSTQFVLQYLVPDEHNPGTIQIKNITNNVAKTFVISHPNDPKRYLVHATLEGPEAAVYYRGSAALVNGRAEITLPPYFEALTRQEGRTVQLTNVDGFDRLAIESQQGRKFHNGTFIVISDSPVSEQAFDWEVKAVRADVPRLETAPARDRVAVGGFGPYTFIEPASAGGAASPACAAVDGNRGYDPCE